MVFHDHLVTQPVLELVRRDAELICVGKRAGEHSVPQHETNQLLVEAAKAGKTVVRLKGGDPFVKTNKHGHGTDVQVPKGSSPDVKAKLAQIAAAAVAANNAELGEEA